MARPLLALAISALVAAAAPAAAETRAALAFSRDGFADLFNAAANDLGLVARSTLRSCIEEEAVACTYAMSPTVQGFTTGDKTDPGAERLILRLPEEESWHRAQIIDGVLAVLYPDLPAGTYLPMRASVLNALHPAIRPHTTEVAGLKLSVVAGHKGNRWLVVQRAP